MTPNQQLSAIKGGYKYVYGAVEVASLIGTAIDIRLGLGKENVNRTIEKNFWSMPEQVESLECIFQNKVLI